MKIGNIEINKGVLLAPMENVTDQPFRLICKRMGADIVYTEFIASEGLIRDSVKSFKKMVFSDEERPIGVQIFGGNLDSMIQSAKIVEAAEPDLLDINFGCWVPKVIKNNAGAALLKEPKKMAEIAHAIVDSISIPVTVKTRLGWNESNIVILETAKLLEDAGIQALTVHCRTREMGMSGKADWSWIAKVREAVNMPIILNGDVFSAYDVKRAFDETGCDALMIARGAIGNPFIFRHAKNLMENGKEPVEPTIDEKIDTCLLHLRLNIESKGLPRGLNEFRKHYSGYLKGLYNSHPVRQDVVVMNSYGEIEERLENYREEYKERFAEIVDNFGK